MSNVTNVILTFDLGEEKALAHLNEALPRVARESARKFGNISDSTDCYPLIAGTKAFERTVCLGAFNGIDVEELTDLVRETPWESPSNVQVFVSRPNDDWFIEIDLS